MAGSPGAGKSTLARAIGAASGAVVLDNDVIRSAILESDISVPQAGRAAYETLFALAADLLKQGHRVILDSPCHFQSILDLGTETANEAGVAYRFIECICPERAEIERRLTTRTPLRSQPRGLNLPPIDVASITPATNQSAVHQWETFRPAAGALRLDTSGPLDTYLPAALAYLEGANPG